MLSNWDLRIYKHISDHLSYGGVEVKMGIINTSWELASEKNMLKTTTKKKNSNNKYYVFRNHRGRASCLQMDFSPCGFETNRREFCAEL